MPMLTTLRMARPVWPRHSPVRTRRAKSAILSSTRVHHGDDVDPVDHDRRARRCPQGHVEDGPVLGDVDPLAGEHVLRALAQAGRLGQGDQQVDGARR